ncbi:mitochondrial ribosomal protein L22 precursor [Klebsormidium nitens]|uniref:Large ribosomal subunit protein uL22c n=1 Tax=Klebsormidium nitens TaxID=105231 RepID=A0A1Y1HXX3_KLENI|nr:mitochondrial ribosomal protein L22 precursor [Klebsormidium nitens]|eukprot:GAQ83514.1 mitochondrial ribosomal protein L22 precursor [Klebsormidium nitens]
MMGIRSLRLSFQPTKENLLTLLQGSALWRNKTIITVAETFEISKLHRSSEKAESDDWERRWSGGQATCSGGSTDRSANNSATFVVEDRSQGTDVQFVNGSAENAASGRSMHSRDKRLLWSDLLFSMHGGNVANADGMLRRTALGLCQANLGYGTAFRSPVTLLQKVGFATEAPRPVPSPLQMLPSPVKTLDDALDPEQEAKRAQCVAKGLPMSPYKLNLVAKVVRGMSVQEALDQLEASPKRAAIPVYKAIHSARANAGHSHNMDTERLVIEKCFVGHGQHLKRLSYHAKGRSGVRKRRRAHLTVILKELEAPKAEKLRKVEAMKFHPAELRWVNRPKRAQTWIEQLTARALEKKKQALDQISSPASR